MLHVTAMPGSFIKLIEGPETGSAGRTKTNLKAKIKLEACLGIRPSMFLRLFLAVTGASKGKHILEALELLREALRFFNTLDPVTPFYQKLLYEGRRV